MVPTHDRPDLLRRTLGTVLWQEGVDLEVVVVDDGDASRAAHAAGHLADSRVRVLQTPRPHSGPCAARNVGIEATTAPWIAFVDDDDLWAPDKLISQLQAVRQMPSAGWVTTGSVAINATLDLGAWSPPPPPGPQPRQVAVNLIPGGGSATMVSRQLIEHVGQFDVSMRHHGDYEMWVRVSTASPLATVARPLTGYTVHDSGLSRGTAGGRAALAQMRPQLARLQQAMGVPAEDERYEYQWGALELRSGRRWAAAATYGGLALRKRSPRLIARAGWAAISPQTLLRRSQRWEQRQIPESVRIEASSWLDLVPPLQS